MRKLFYILIALLCFTNQVQSAVTAESDTNLWADNFIKIHNNDTQQWAKTYWLPDYQSDQSGRVNDGGKISCADEYKYTPANCSGKYAPSGESCKDKFNKCTCTSQYQYNDITCSGDKKPMGESCDGSFNQCEYKTCVEGGFLADTESGKICTDVHYAGKTCYTCREKTCSEKCSDLGYSSGIDNCQLGQVKETCSGCGEFARCTGAPCPSAKTNCDYGCATTSSQIRCESVCVECKTCTKDVNCTVANYPYLAAEKPMNGIFEECSVGCGDNTIRYKMAQCLIGYANPNTYWCSIPKNTSCATLGYVASSSCGSREIVVRCPFDSTMVYCPNII